MSISTALALAAFLVALAAMRASPWSAEGRSGTHGTPGAHALVSLGGGVIVALAILPIAGPPVALGAGLAAGLFLVSRRHRARARVGWRAASAIERDLADVLDLLATSLAAGVPLDRALAWSADHAPAAVALPLTRCVDLLAAGARRRQTFALLESGPSQDLARVGAALAIADSLGAPLAVPLREQASLQRELRRARVRERAARASPKIALTVGLVFVPAALLIVLGAEMLATFGSQMG